MHSEHFKIFHLLRNKELNEIYISILLRNFAFGLIGIFTALYLLIELQYPFVSVLLFYLIIYATLGLFSPVAAKMASKIGLKHCMFISIPLHLIFFILFYLLKYGIVHYTILAVMSGVAAALFWIPFHSDFAKFSDKKGRGQEVSIWLAIHAVSATLGPIVGALIITKTGSFAFLFFGVIAIGALSIIPLFFSKDSYPKSKFSYKKMFKKYHLKETVALAGAGSHSVGDSVLWPIFIFLILGTYLKLGSLASLSGVVVAGFAIFSGQLTKRIADRRIIRIGANINSLFWFVRIFLKSFLSLFFATVIGLLSFTFADVAFHSKSYTRAKKSHQALDYIVYRELCYNMGRVFIVFFTLILFYILKLILPGSLNMQYSMVGAFILTGLVTLFMKFY